MTSANRFWLAWTILILLWAFLCTSNIFAMTFKEYINQPITITETKGELRLKWHNFFGCDLFKPYFAIKDLEDSFTVFTALDLGRLKGRLHFGNNYKSIEYKFKYEF
jgi:hypothetical protein